MYFCMDEGEKNSQMEEKYENKYEIHGSVFRKIN